MAIVRLIIYDNGAGWCVRSRDDAVELPAPGRPYDQRDDAISDALFTARMLRAMGDEAVVYVANSDGLKVVSEETLGVFRVH